MLHDFLPKKVCCAVALKESLGKKCGQLGMSVVKLKWGKESDRLIGNGPLLLELCKWKSKLEMSSPLVPKTIHLSSAAANFVCV